MLGAKRRPGRFGLKRAAKFPPGHGREPGCGAPGHDQQRDRGMGLAKTAMETFFPSPRRKPEPGSLLRRPGFGLRRKEGRRAYRLYRSVQDGLGLGCGVAPGAWPRGKKNGRRRAVGLPVRSPAAHRLAKSSLRLAWSAPRPRLFARPGRPPRLRRGGRAPIGRGLFDQVR